MAVILSKNIFLASNFFMQMFNESILCRQSTELFQHKLWYNKNQKGGPLRAMKTFIRRKVGHTM